MIILDREKLSYDTMQFAYKIKSTKHMRKGDALYSSDLFSIFIIVKYVMFSDVINSLNKLGFEV